MTDKKIRRKREKKTRIVGYKKKKKYIKLNIRETCEIMKRKIWRKRNTIRKRTKRKIRKKSLKSRKYEKK